MPVILPGSTYEQWLTPGEHSSGKLQPLLMAYPGDEMEAYAVSTPVNSPYNDSPGCIAPLT